MKGIRKRYAEGQFERRETSAVTKAVEQSIDKVPRATTHLNSRMAWRNSADLNATTNLVLASNGATESSLQYTVRL